MANIGLIAQNFDIFEGDGLDKFARTGCISPNHLLQVGAQGVILGHSEVGDEPEIVNKKILYLSNANTPLKKLIILVGETWDEFQNNKQKPVTCLMNEKCEIIFKDVPAEFINKVIIGYEPKWSVYGSGRDDVPPPNPESISLCISGIRNFIFEKYKDKIKPFYVYGGSLTPDRTKQLFIDNANSPLASIPVAAGCGVLLARNSVSSQNCEIGSLQAVGHSTQFHNKNIDGVILGSACNSVKKTIDIANTMGNVCLSRKKIIICNFKAYELQDSYEKYVNELKRFSDDFVILLAPPYTDIYRIRKLLEDKNSYYKSLALK